jgi:hypothetical protein
MAGANDRQVGGTHYAGRVQHWDMVDMFQLDYFQGQITKYVMRWHKKNGLEDLLKARHFLDKYIELNSNQAEAGPGYVNQDGPTTPERQSKDNPSTTQYDQFSRPHYGPAKGLYDPRL